MATSFFVAGIGAGFGPTGAGTIATGGSAVAVDTGAASTLRSAEAGKVEPDAGAAGVGFDPTGAAAAAAAGAALGGGDGVDDWWRSRPWRPVAEETAGRVL